MLNMKFLDNCTKEELVTLIRQSYSFRPPFTERDLLRLRWNKECDKAETLSKKAQKILDSADGKKRDDLARQFNKSLNTEERIRIAKDISRIDKVFKSYLTADKKADQQRIVSDKAFKTLDGFREKETN